MFTLLDLWVYAPVALSGVLYHRQRLALCNADARAHEDTGTDTDTDTDTNTDKDTDTDTETPKHTQLLKRKPSLDAPGLDGQDLRASRPSLPPPPS